MIRYEFKEEESSLGIILRPVADAVLEQDECRVEVSMYIDSGADISMIPYRFGKALGFKQEKGDVIREIKGISGAGIPYIIKETTLVLNNKSLKVKIAWALIEEVPMLMGRTDIFNKFCIIFNEKKGWIDFEE
ncbi:MAG: aspartyl protease family protein [bacterium]